MTSIALTPRRRTGTALIAVGALLLTMSALMLVGLAPGAGADHGDGPIVEPVLWTDGSGGNASCADAGSYDNSWPGAQTDHGGRDIKGASAGVAGVVTWSTDGTEVSWSADPVDHDGIVFILKGGDASNFYYYGGEVSHDNGLVAPDGATLSNLTICWNNPAAVEDTTTTTVVGDETTTTVAGPGETTPTVAGADETTTTVAGIDEDIAMVAGPDETTTTVGGVDENTTMVLGPDITELPETGPGEVLVLLAAGLGLLFVGSGSLVIAGDRRRAV